MSRNISRLLLSLRLLLLPATFIGRKSAPVSVSAYSFAFNNFPEQCGNVNISITGDGGRPPYRVSIVPFGGSPLDKEVRRIMDLQFNDSSSINFRLPYPANSLFVAVVSDDNGQGFGTGGVSVPVNVQSSDQNDCLPTSQVAPRFVFSTEPLGVLTTCQTSLLSWPSNAQGTVNFWAIIPGGNAFLIPRNSLTKASNGDQAISYTPDIRPGTNLLVVAGDDGGGFGSGGSLQVALQPGNGTLSCIDGDSPISTTGNPAGGMYPTNTRGDTTIPTTKSSSSSSATSSTDSSTGGARSTEDGGASGKPSDSNHRSNNIGAIVGGIVGGISALIIIILLSLLLLRRRRRDRGQSGYNRRRRPDVDLLDGRPQSEIVEGLPGHYAVTPFFMGNDRPPHGHGHGHSQSVDSTHDLMHEYRPNTGTGTGRPSFTDLDSPVEHDNNSSPYYHNNSYSRRSLSSSGAGYHSPRSPMMSKSPVSANAPPSSFRPLGAAAAAAPATPSVYQHEDAGEVSMSNEDGNDDQPYEIPPAYGSRAKTSTGVAY